MKKIIIPILAVIVILIITAFFIVSNKNKDDDTSSDTSSSDTTSSENNNIVVSDNPAPPPPSVEPVEDLKPIHEVAENFLKAYYTIDVTEFNSAEHYNNYADLLTKGAQYSLGISHPDDVKTDTIKYKSSIHKLKIYDSEKYQGVYKMIVFVKLNVKIEDNMPYQTDNMILLEVSDREDNILKINNMLINEEMQGFDINPVYD